MSPVDQANLLQSLLKKTAREPLISFTAGFPAEELLPINEIRNSYEAVLHDINLLQYSTDSKGDHSLREQIQYRLTRRNIHVSTEELLVTTGSSQAIDLVARVLTSKGDVVLVEKPTYQEVLKLLHLQEITIVGVESDKDGMVLEDVEEKIKTHSPKFIYVNPTFGNPNGKVWSTERRKKLIELCEQYGIVILEDDPYGELNFQPDTNIPTLYELEKEKKTSNVIYVSTFSKIIAPAVRVGYLVANPSVLSALTHTKVLSVIHSSTVDQKAISYYLQNYDLDERISLLTKEYQMRLNEMDDELSIQFGNDAKWLKPTGGIYLWLEISKDVNPMQLLEHAIKAGVSYLPGQFFYVDDPDLNAIRLNFTFPSKDKIREGIQKLAAVYHEFK